MVDADTAQRRAEELQASFKKKVSIMRAYLAGRDYHHALNALELGLAWHTGLRRDKMTPEYAHQIEISFYLLTLEPHLCSAENVVATALLHDLREDYPAYTYHQLQHDFPPEIAGPVELLNKGRSSGGTNHQLSDAEYYAAIAEDPVASITKGADRLHNISSMFGVFKPAKQISYIEETETLVLPMLKTARRRFTKQTPAYENIKFVLITLNRHIRAALNVEAAAA